MKTTDLAKSLKPYLARWIGDAFASRQGTAFPTDPALFDRFFRTDRGIEYYYDGTRWLSVHEYPVEFTSQRLLLPTTTAGIIGDHVIDSRYSALWTAFVVRSRVETTNSASNYYTLSVGAYSPAGQTRTLFSQTTASDGVDVTITRTFTPNLIKTSSEIILALQTTKTGTPGVIYLSARGWYRLIG